MTRGISFVITYAVVNFFAILPFRILNGIGHGVYLLLEYVIQYRKNIILKNLRNSFPEKSQNEIHSLKKNFYRHFSRLLVENIKMFHLPLRKLEKHIKLKNPEMIRKYFEAGTDVAVMAAHYGNWEWLLGLRKDIPHHTIGIYKTLNNKYFNAFFTRHRSQYNTEMVSMREIPRVLMKYKQSGRPTLTLFITDQSPVWEEIQYWTTFLRQLTPVYLGTEKLARKMKMAVLYFRITVEPNNHYSVEAIPIADNATLLEDFEITERYFNLLEEDILNAPEYWLWSHRRWKLTEKRHREEKSGNFRFEGKIRKK